MKKMKIFFISALLGGIPTLVLGLFTPLGQWAWSKGLFVVEEKLPPEVILSLLITIPILLVVLATTNCRTIRKQILYLRYENDPAFSGLYRGKRNHDKKACPRCMVLGYLSPMHIRDPEEYISCPDKDCGHVISHPDREPCELV